MSINLDALFHTCKAILPEMKKSSWGRIVNLGGLSAHISAIGRAHVITSKTAVVGLTRQMAVDFGPDNIRVNAIAPGHIVTEGIQKVWEQNPTGLQFLENQYPLRKTGVPDDIAEGIAFLCSNQASFITGHTLVIDGGLSIQLQEKFGIRQAVFARNQPDVQITDADYQKEKNK